MKRTLLIAALFMPLALSQDAKKPTFKLVPGWCKPPDGKPLGKSHGEVAVDEAGNVYVSTDTFGRSILVFGADGKFKKTIANKYVGIHGFTIHGGFLFAAHLAGSQVLKLKLDGSLVWKAGADLVPADRRGKRYLPTAVTVGPQGNVFVVDGYGADWIHVLDAQGNYVRSFGGRGAPFGFRNCHKIAIDPRFDPPRILACDRANNRLVHVGLDGKLIGVAATGLRRPSAVSFYKDWVAVAEIQGRVSILDKSHKTVAVLGDNPDRTQWNTPRVPPDQWKPGVFTAPHGIAFDKSGNLYVAEWNNWGRLVRFDLRP